MIIVVRSGIAPHFFTSQMFSGWLTPNAALLETGLLNNPLAHLLAAMPLHTATYMPPVFTTKILPACGLVKSR